MAAVNASVAATVETDHLVCATAFAAVVVALVVSSETALARSAVNVYC